MVGVGLAISELWVVFFIFSSSSQAIMVNVIWSICGGNWPPNSFRQENERERYDFDLTIFMRIVIGIVIEIMEARWHSD